MEGATGRQAHRLPVSRVSGRSDTRGVSSASPPSSGAPSPSSTSSRSSRTRPRRRGAWSGFFGTFQDRLVGELRLARITTLEEANRFLPSYLARHNAHFAKAPTDPEPAWRALPAGASIESVCCLKYARLVAHDNTLTFAGATVQLPPKGRWGSWAGETVEVRHHLDGSFSAHVPQGRELARSAAPNEAPTIRTQKRPARPGGVQPLRKDPAHPWRQWRPGQFRGKYARIPRGVA